MLFHEDILQAIARLEAKVEALQTSMNQLLQGESKIMGSLAALQQADTLLDQAVQALTSQEASMAASIGNALTFIQNQLAAGNITPSDAQPIITDLQNQATAIQGITTAIQSAQATLQNATSGQASGASSAAPSSSSSAEAPAAAN